MPDLGNEPTQTAEIEALYHRLIAGWNQRSAASMTEPSADDGEMIGYDGSHLAGRSAMAAHLSGIFADHPTPPYRVCVKSVRLLGAETAILRAIAGMAPPGRSDLDPNLNTHQVLIAHRQQEAWRIAFFQNTPAQFHGRPDLVRQFTDELRSTGSQP